MCAFRVLLWCWDLLLAPSPCARHYLFLSIGFVVGLGSRKLRQNTSGGRIAGSRQARWPPRFFCSAERGFWLGNAARGTQCSLKGHTWWSIRRGHAACKRTYWNHQLCDKQAHARVGVGSLHGAVHHVRADAFLSFLAGEGPRTLSRHALTDNSRNMFGAAL